MSTSFLIVFVVVGLLYPSRRDFFVPAEFSRVSQAPCPKLQKSSWTSSTWVNRYGVTRDLHPALVICVCVCVARALVVCCCGTSRVLLLLFLAGHVRAVACVYVQAQTSTCRRLLEDQKFALQPTLIDQLLAENAQFPPVDTGSADTGGGASAEDTDEDEDSEDNDAPPLPKPASGKDDQNDNTTGSNNSSAAAATSSTSHVVSKSVSGAPSSSSSAASRTTPPAATPDSAEVANLANALTAFYKAVGADKTRPDAERSARMFAGTKKACVVMCACR